MHIRDIIFVDNFPTKQIYFKLRLFYISLSQFDLYEITFKK